MARRDYYGVLGVKRDASQDEIKRAYRVLAMDFHPDRNPDDDRAERRFREVVEAYETLGDARARARYDRLGPLYRADGRPPRPEDINDFVVDTIGALFGRKHKPEQGQDLRYTLSISLEDAARGADHAIDVRRRHTCKKCGGDGADPADGKVRCETCNGTGRSNTRRLLRSDCPRCDGTGWRIVRRCPRCGGKGWQEDAEHLVVKVPAGVATGQKLKLRGKGHVGERGGKAGDLYVIVAIDEHPIFHRRGADLHCEAPLLWTEAALGTDLDIPTLDGTTTIRVPAGTPSGKTFRLAGRGLPVLGKRRRGDLHVQVQVQVPPDLDPTQRRAAQQLAAAVDASAHPARQAWDKAMHDRRPHTRSDP